MLSNIVTAPEEALETAYKLALESTVESLGGAESIPEKQLREEAQAALKELAS